MLTATHISLALGILGLAFLGLLCLGFYERRRTFDLLGETMQRLIATTASTRGPLHYPPPLAVPPPQMMPASDSSDDAVWNEKYKEWVAEAALDLRAQEESRAAVISESLRKAQERKAAEYAAQGKLEVEPAAEQVAPPSSSP